MVPVPGSIEFCPACGCGIGFHDAVNRSLGLEDNARNPFDPENHQIENAVIPVVYPVSVLEMRHLQPISIWNEWKLYGVLCTVNSDGPKCGPNKIRTHTYLKCPRRRI